MNVRIINILLLISLFIAGVVNLNPLLHLVNQAFGWQLHVSIGDPYVIQEFHYHTPEAGEVYLVWGEQGWQQMPEAVRPPGTVVEFGVTATPMTRQGDTFIAQLYLPVGTILDYGFQIRSARNGAILDWVWDGDYQQLLTTDNLIEREASGMLSQALGSEQRGRGLVVTPKFRTLIPQEMLWQVPVLVRLRDEYQAQLASYPIRLGLLLAGIGAIIIGIGAALVKHSTASGKRRVISLRRWTYVRDLLGELVGREMKLRYRRSLLGVAWSLINPLLQLLIFSFVFRYVLPLDIPNYSLFLFNGLLVWNWLQGSLLGATTAIIDGGNLIRHPSFPATILPVATVTANFVHFLLALPILFLFLWLAGIPLTFALWFLPVIMALQFLFTLGLAYFLATIHVSMRDTQHLVIVILLFLFYLTPIFYEPAMVPAQFRDLYELNPILHLMQAYRAILLHGELPALAPLGSLTILSAILLFWGWQLYRQASYQFVEEL